MKYILKQGTLDGTKYYWKASFHGYTDDIAKAHHYEESEIPEFFDAKYGEKIPVVSTEETASLKRQSEDLQADYVALLERARKAEGEVAQWRRSYQALHERFVKSQTLAFEAQQQVVAVDKANKELVKLAAADSERVAKAEADFKSLTRTLGGVVNGRRLFDAPVAKPVDCHVYKDEAGRWCWRDAIPVGEGGINPRAVTNWVRWS